MSVLKTLAEVARVVAAMARAVRVLQEDLYNCKEAAAKAAVSVEGGYLQARTCPLP